MKFLRFAPFLTNTTEFGVFWVLNTYTIRLTRVSASSYADFLPRIDLADFLLETFASFSYNYIAYPEDILSYFNITNSPNWVSIGLQKARFSEKTLALAIYPGTYLKKHLLTRAFSKLVQNYFCTKTKNRLIVYRI